MSPAEIEKLKFGAVVPPHLQALLPRLLEERERLLEAPRKVELTDWCADADDALAFATAPAGKEEK